MRISLIFLISGLHKPSWNYESNLLDVSKLSIKGVINRKSLTIPHAFIVQLQGNFWTAKKKKKLLFFQRETCVTFQKKSCGLTFFCTSILSICYETENVHPSDMLCIFLHTKNIWDENR